MNTKMIKMALAGVVLSVSGFANASFISTTITSNNSLTIPASGTSGVASSFPTLLDVSGVLGTIVDVNVFLTGVSHTFPDDINIGIVGPTDVAVYLWADAGGGGDIQNLDITFDDAALSAMANGGQILSGSYQVSQFGWDNPNIPASFGSILADFNGLSANGLWSLYVLYNTGGDVGSMQGWGLEIITEVTDVPEPSTLAILGLGLMGLASRRFKKQP